MTEEARELKIEQLEEECERLRDDKSDLESEVSSLEGDLEEANNKADEYDSLSEAARHLVNALRERGDIANIAVFGLEIIEKIEAVEGLV